MSNILILLSKYRQALMGIAILWVMMFHLPLRPGIPIIKEFFNIGYGGVDIFLFLSGFGLYFSLSKKEIKLSHYYKKRFYRILPEFWLFLIITYFLSMDFSLHSICNLIYRATTIGYWIPHTPYNLWYISCILFLYIIYPFYYKALQKKGLKIGITAVCTGLILSLLYAFVMIVFFENKAKGGLLILTIARIPIFFIGSIAGHLTKESTDFKITNKTIISILILFILSILSLEIAMHQLQNYLWTCSLFFLPFIIITPILCILIGKLLDIIPTFIATFFSKIGTISLELYIVHEYIYSKMFTNLTAIYGQYSSAIIMIILSFVAAIMLYYINKTLLQRICEKIL